MTFCCPFDRLRAVSMGRTARTIGLTMSDIPHSESSDRPAKPTAHSTGSGQAPSTGGPLRDLSATALIILLGLQAMMVQIILIRESLIIFQGNELCFGVVFAAWLVGIAVGASIGAHLACGTTALQSDLHPIPPRGDFVGVFGDGQDGMAGIKACRPCPPIAKNIALALLLIMAVLPIAQVYLIRVQRLWLHVLPGELAPFTSLLWSSLLTITPFSSLVGLVFPFAYPLFRQWTSNPSAAIGRLYVIEASGSVLGGIMFTFYVAGMVDPFSTLTITGLALCLLVLAYTGEKDSDPSASLRTGPAADNFLVASAYLTVLLGCFLLSGLATKKHYETVIARWNSFNANLSYVTSEDSRYENLVVARQRKQFSLFGNGQYMFSFPDEPTYAQQAGLVLTEHPNPKRVLLIGGGVGGLLRQMLVHHLDQLDYVELDPKLIWLVRKFLPEEDRQALRDSRVNVIYEDGRYFVKHARDKYDLIFVNLPDPSTAMVNRFYTQDFFQEAKTVLKPDGVLATRISSAVGYLGEEVGLYAASLDHTLRDVFAKVIVSPGDVNYFFACDAPNVVTFDLPTLMSRYRARDIKTKYFSEYLFATLLQPEMVENLARQLESRKDVPINTDFRPVTYFFNLMLWDQYAGGQLAGFYRWVRRAHLWWIGLMVGVLWAARLAYVTLTPNRADPHRRFNVLLVIFCAGLAGLSWELVLIFTFQNVYGYVYERMGLIIAAFMLGLVAGGAWSNRRDLGETAASRSLSRLTLAIMLYSCVLPIVLWLLAHVKIEFRWLETSSTVLMILTGLAGFLTGAPFPLASRLHLALGGKAGRAAGLVDSVDHLGAFVGALFTGVLLIPLLGIVQTSLTIALVNAACLVLLVIPHRKH